MRKTIQPVYCRLSFRRFSREAKRTVTWRVRIVSFVSSIAKRVFVKKFLLSILGVERFQHSNLRYYMHVRNEIAAVKKFVC